MNLFRCPCSDFDMSRRFINCDIIVIIIIIIISILMGSLVTDY